MEIDPARLSSRERYALLVSTVVPRPIGWVSTLNANHEANLAPFSFFNAVNAVFELPLRVLKMVVSGCRVQFMVSLWYFFAVLCSGPDA